MKNQTIKRGVNALKIVNFGLKILLFGLKITVAAINLLVFMFASTRIFKKL